MFTGIVQAVGRIAAVEPQGDGLRIARRHRHSRCRRRCRGRQHRGQRLLPDDRRGQRLDADVRRVGGNACLHDAGSIASATSTWNWRCVWPTGSAVTSSAGHVDGVGTVTRFAAVAGDAGGSFSLEIEAPAELARFIAAKGSIAVHGVSLTVNSVDGARFTREPDSAHAGGDHARRSRARWQA